MRILRTLRHHPVRYAGAFLTLALATALIGLTLIGIVARPAGTIDGGPVIVLDGQSFARDAPDLGGVGSVLAVSGACSALVAVLVVAGAFSFSVALRRRELALLRLVAATGRQLRRMVLTEAVAVALPAAVLGCVVAVFAAPALLRLVHRLQLSPVPLVAEPGPVLLSSTVVGGVSVALLGAAGAARRAARVRPTEAFREADLDTGVMTLGRWLLAAPLLAGALLLLALAPSVSTEASTPVALFGGLTLTAALAVLAPTYLPFFARLSRRSLAGVGRRRTAALAIPVLSVVGATGVLASVLTGTAATALADQRARTLAELVVTSPSTVDTVDRVRHDPDVVAVAAAVAVPAVLARADGADLVTVTVVDLPDLVATTRLCSAPCGATPGLVGALAPDEIAVSAEYAGWYGLRPGTALRLGLFDGRVVPVTVAAVLDAGASTPTVVATPALISASPADHALVRLRPGADPTIVAARLARDGVTVRPAGEFLADAVREQDSLNTVALALIVGPTVLFGLVAVAGVAVMAASDRHSDIATLRLLGAGRARLRLDVLAETTVAVLAGALAGVAVASVAAFSYRSALRVAYGIGVVDLPWTWLVGLAAASALTAAAAGRLRKTSG